MGLVMGAGALPGARSQPRRRGKCVGGAAAMRLSHMIRQGSAVRQHGIWQDCTVGVACNAEDSDAQRASLKDRIAFESREE